MLRFLALALLVVLPVANAGTIPGVTSTKLKNGLEVIVVENHAVPLVTIEVAVKSGGYVESPEYSGLSHLYEHMFFKGNKAIPNQEQYLKRLRELGAGWNGTTSTERVNYFFTVPTENLREGTEFMRNALLDPLFNQKELERERVVVLGEFDRAEANPRFHLSREIDRRLWYQYPSRKDVIGDRDAIATTPREKMITIKNRYYVPNNSALLFAGDITPEEAYALAEEFFSDWKPTEDPHKLYPVPKHPPLKQSSTLAVIQPVKTATLIVQWHGPGMTSDVPATFAADVLSFIFGQPNSRFHKNLIDSGLFDEASLVYLSQVHTGPIIAGGTTTADRVDRAHAAMRKEIDAMSSPDYFTDEELAFAKDQLEVAEIYGRERTSNFVHTVSFWWTTGGLKYYEDYIDNLRKVSRADIQSYVKRYIQGKPSVTGVLVSEEDRPTIELLKTAEVVRPKSGTSATAMASTETSPVKTEEFDVDGLRVVLRSNPQSEVVTAKAFLQGGLSYAGAERAGLELLMLEAGEKQSENFPKEKMGRELTRLGARLSSEANQDFSTFTLNSVQKNFPESMKIFLDALVRPVFTESEVALARERRLTQLSREVEDPDSYLERLAVENAYGSHAFALNPLGTPERIRAVTAADLKKLHDTTVNRSRLLLVVVGNVTPDQLVNLIRPVVADLPRGNFVPRDPAAMPAVDRASTRLVARELPTVYLMGLYPMANPASPDYPAAYVGTRILGQRLWEEIRTKRNLSYAPSAWMNRSSLNTGALYVSTPKPNETLQVIADEVRKIQASPPSETEVRNAVNVARTQLLTGMQASEDIARWLGLFELGGGGWEKLDGFIARLGTVTPEDVRRAMATYAHKVDFAVLGNIQGLDEKLLTSF